MLPAYSESVEALPDQVIYIDARDGGTEPLVRATRQQLNELFNTVIAAPKPPNDDYRPVVHWIDSDMVSGSGNVPPNAVLMRDESDQLWADQFYDLVGSRGQPATLDVVVYYIRGSDGDVLGDEGYRIYRCRVVPTNIVETHLVQPGTVGGYQSSVRLRLEPGTTTHWFGVFPSDKKVFDVLFSLLDQELERIRSVPSGTSLLSSAAPTGMTLPGLTADKTRALVDAQPRPRQWSDVTRLLGVETLDGMRDVAGVFVYATQLYNQQRAGTTTSPPIVEINENELAKEFNRTWSHSVVQRAQIEGANRMLIFYELLTSNPLMKSSHGEPATILPVRDSVLRVRLPSGANTPVAVYHVPDRDINTRLELSWSTPAHPPQETVGEPRWFVVPLQAISTSPVLTASSAFINLIATLRTYSAGNVSGGRVTIEQTNFIQLFVEGVARQLGSAGSAIAYSRIFSEAASDLLDPVFIEPLFNVAYPSSITTVRMLLFAAVDERPLPAGLGQFGGEQATRQTNAPLRVLVDRHRRYLDEWSRKTKNGGWSKVLSDRETPPLMTTTGTLLPPPRRLAALHLVLLDNDPAGDTSLLLPDSASFDFSMEATIAAYKDTNTPLWRTLPADLITDEERQRHQLLYRQISRDSLAIEILRRTLQWRTFGAMVAKKIMADGNPDLDDLVKTSVNNVGLYRISGSMDAVFVVTPDAVVPLYFSRTLDNVPLYDPKDGTVTALGVDWLKTVVNTYPEKPPVVSWPPSINITEAHTDSVLSDPTNLRLLASVWSESVSLRQKARVALSRRQWDSWLMERPSLVNWLSPPNTTFDDVPLRPMLERLATIQSVPRDVVLVDSLERLRQVGQAMLNMFDQWVPLAERAYFQLHPLSSFATNVAETATMNSIRALNISRYLDTINATQQERMFVNTLWLLPEPERRPDPIDLIRPQPVQDLPFAPEQVWPLVVDTRQPSKLEPHWFLLDEEEFRKQAAQLPSGQVDVVRKLWVAYKLRNPDKVDTAPDLPDFLRNKMPTDIRYDATGEKWTLGQRPWFDEQRDQRISYIVEGYVTPSVADLTKILEEEYQDLVSARAAAEALAHDARVRRQTLSAATPRTDREKRYVLLTDQKVADKRRQQEEERKRKEEQERKRKEEQERKRKEEQERKRKEEQERKRKEEEERKRKEEEERKRKEEQERKRKEEEERKRKEEEERKRKEEEERKRKEEEERKRKEEEEKQKKKEKEKETEEEKEERKRKEEEERKRKEEEERKRKEKEERKRKEEEEERQKQMLILATDTFVDYVNKYKYESALGNRGVQPSFLDDVAEDARKKATDEILSQMAKVKKMDYSLSRQEIVTQAEELARLYVDDVIDQFASPIAPLQEAANKATRQSIVLAAAVADKPQPSSPLLSLTHPPPRVPVVERPGLSYEAIKNVILSMYAFVGKLTYVPVPTIKGNAEDFLKRHYNAILQIYNSTDTIKELQNAFYEQFLPQFAGLVEVAVKVTPIVPLVTSTQELLSGDIVVTGSTNNLFFHQCGALRKYAELNYPQKSPYRGARLSLTQKEARQDEVAILAYAMFSFVLDFDSLHLDGSPDTRKKINSLIVAIVGCATKFYELRNKEDVWNSSILGTRTGTKRAVVFSGMSTVDRRDVEKGTDYDEKYVVLTSYRSYFVNDADARNFASQLLEFTKKHSFFLETLFFRRNLDEDTYKDSLPYYPRTQHDYNSADVKTHALIVLMPFAEVIADAAANFTSDEKKSLMRGVLALFHHVWFEIEKVDSVPAAKDNIFADRQLTDNGVKHVLAGVEKLVGILSSKGENTIYDRARIQGSFLPPMTIRQHVDVRLTEAFLKAMPSLRYTTYTPSSYSVIKGRPVTPLLEGTTYFVELHPYMSIFNHLIVDERNGLKPYEEALNTLAGESKKTGVEPEQAIVAFVKTVKPDKGVEFLSNPTMYMVYIKQRTEFVLKRLEETYVRKISGSFPKVSDFNAEERFKEKIVNYFVKKIEMTKEDAESEYKNIRDDFEKEFEVVYEGPLSYFYLST